MNHVKTLPLAAIVTLVAATSASAVSLNPRGMGQALIYPYYTVKKNQDTLVTIGNASSVGKAVGVLVKEGINGRWVQDFTLYLSAHDVWTGRISRSSNGEGATLFTSDHSCTYAPQGGATGVPLNASFYNGGAFPPDGGPSGLDRTEEGFITVVALGDIEPGSPLDLATQPVQNGAPNAGMPPCTESEINNNAIGSLLVPGEGLFGSSAIVNVGEGTFFADSALALSDLTDLVLFNGTGAFRDPLALANSSESADYSVFANLFDANGRALSVRYENGIDAVSAVLMSDAIDNDYLVSAGLGANTDWIVSFPTKPFYTDAVFYNLTAPGYKAPFVESFGQVVAGQSRVQTSCTAYDQEALALGGSTACTLTLPYTVNLVSFLNTDAEHPVSGVFGAALATNLRPSAQAGYVHLGLDPANERHVLGSGLTEQGTVELNGLPAVGFMVYNIINANAQAGQLANYGGVFPHRSTISCTAASGNGTGPC